MTPRKLPKVYFSTIFACDTVPRLHHCAILLTQTIAIKTRQISSFFQKNTQRQNNNKKFINHGSSFAYCQATTTSTDRRGKIEDTLPSVQYLGPFWYFLRRTLCVSRGKAAAVAEEILF